MIMPSIFVSRRQRKVKDGAPTRDRHYTARIRFGKIEFLRSTGKTTEREAKIEAKRIAREIELNELAKRAKEVLTLGGMIGGWFEEKGQEQRTARNITWQSKRLLDSLGVNLPVEEIGNKEIHKFVQDSLAGNTGAATINRCLTKLRAIMKHAATKWEIPLKPIDWGAHMLKEPKERDVFFSPEEAAQALTILPRHIGLSFAWTLYTGCRLNETETLDWKNVDLEKRVAYVYGKGLDGNLRPVWLSQNAISILLAAAAGNGGRTGRVFDLTNRRKHWEAARRAIGRDDVHWHDLRAMTATWAQQQKHGAHSLKVIGRALGHSNTTTTSRYAHVVDEEVIEMLDKLPTLSTLTMLTHKPGPE
jgi:integrase